MPVLRGASGDENWDAGFGVPGVEGYISAMAAFRTELFVGGVFSRIGGVEATNVARWDGTNWSALGPGLGSIAEQRGVLALTMIEGDLFAGGAFRSSGTNPISGLAKWNGEAWVPIAGAGRNGLVSALASDGFNLYVGGVFTTIAGINASNVAKWDGTNWSPLGNGVHRWRIGVIEPLVDTAHVRSLAVRDGEVFVGGDFEIAGTISATNVARWDGANWSSVGGGGPGPARALTVSEGRVFAGGDFGVASWVGSDWELNVGNLSQNGYVWVLASSGSELFAGGAFSSIEGVPATGIAKWNGSHWSSLGSGLDTSGGTFAMASNGSDLYVGGRFISAGGKPATNIARWRIPHELKIRRSADKALLSWPATGSNLFLEATLNPAAPNWTVLSNPPGLHGGECVVTNPVTDAGQFFRLRGR